VTWDNFLNELNWLHVAILGLTPILGVVGAYLTRLRWETAVWAVVYYYMTGLGITAGYHRLWAHRSYNASRPLQ
ncbi:hypothetical protein EDC04DRAFT_2500638, partial [Pisolithus marmoratus]